MTKFKIVLSALLAIILLALLGGGFWFLTHRGEDGQQAEYTIIVDDDITVYEGETYTLVPYLLRSDGTTEEARFEYTPSSDAIAVTQGGVVSVRSLPEEGEAVTISVRERNTSAEAEVGVHVIGELSAVLGITFDDGQGNQTLVSGHQQLAFGETYSLRVVTQPRKTDLSKACELSAVDADGEEKEVFGVRVDGTDVRLTAQGLGKGTLRIRIRDRGGKELYFAELGFTVSMREEALGADLLRQEGQTLLSRGELAALERVTVSADVTDISELGALSALDTVVFPAEDVMQLSSVPAQYDYRVRAALFGDYLADPVWGAVAAHIFPYEESADEIYAVLHDEKGGSMACERVSALFTLPEYSYKGYLFSGWADASDASVTSEQVRAIQKNGIHLFAKWKPVTFTVVYHVGKTVEETWDYEQEGLLKALSDLSEETRTGYKFAGWALDADEEYGTADFAAGETVRGAQLSSRQDDVIDLYYVWAPIEYTLRFVHGEGFGAEEIADVTLKYDRPYTLPAGEARGYTFTGWSCGEQRYAAGEEVKNLSATDGEVVVFTSQWTENTYLLRFDPAGGSATDGKDFTNYTVTLKYTQPFTLMPLAREGYKSYVWYADLNNSATQEDDEPTFSAEATVSKVIGSGAVTLRAVWSESTYIVTFDLNGGDELVGAENNREYTYEELVTMPEARREGYTLTHWEYLGNAYSVGQAGNRFTAEEGVVTFTAQWRPNNYTVYFDADGGSVSTASMPCTYGKSFALPIPSRTGYDFAGWTYNGQTFMGKTPVKVHINATGDQIRLEDFSDGAKFTFRAQWSAQQFSVTFSQGSQGDHVNARFLSGVSNKKAYCDSTVTFAIDTSGHDAKVEYVRTSDGTAVKYTGTTSKYSFTMPAADVTIRVRCTSEHGGSCVVAGTPILMGDGGTRLVEDVRIGDEIMAFDHAAGAFTAQKVVYTYYAAGVVDIIDLRFAGGGRLELANAGHGLFDCTLGRYVLITPENAASFVGHTFARAVQRGEGYAVERTELLSAQVRSEYVERYDLVTEKALNHIAGGLIACSDALVGVCDLFAFESDLTYDAEQMAADIAEYGLYTYEEWKDFVTYEEFVAFNGAYFKIAVGKGLLTVQEIFSLIDYLRGWSGEGGAAEA